MEKFKTFIGEKESPSGYKKDVIVTQGLVVLRHVVEEYHIQTIFAEDAREKYEN